MINIEEIREVMQACYFLLNDTMFDPKVEGASFEERLALRERLLTALYNLPYTYKDSER